jgi:TolB-like protein
MTLVSELKRRNVHRATAAYVALSWLLIQIAETVLPAFGFGGGAVRAVIIALMIGFVPAMVLAWAFELTPEGVKREQDLDHRSALAQRTNRLLDRLIMLLLALALAYFSLDKFVFDPARDRAREEVVARQARSDALVESYGENSVVVLPFVNMSGDPDNEYFSDGISEELLNLLANVPELRVISRSSAFAFKGKDLKIGEIAEQLNVAHVLEGSVRKAGDRVRITAQLVDARSDTHLWSATYDRGFDDIFAIQDEIATEVVRHLKITLLGEAPRAPEMDPEAYALYLRAGQLLMEFKPENIPVAEALLRQALDRDPQNVRVVLGLVFAQFQRYGASPDPQSQEQEKLRLRELVAQAEVLDPDSNLLPAWHAHLAELDGDLAATARHAERALERSPTDLATLAIASRVAQALGRYDEAIGLIEYQVRLDPMCIVCRYDLSKLYREVGRLDEAEAAVRALQVLAPDWNMKFSHARTLLFKGEAQAALDLIAGQEVHPPQMLSFRAMALHDLGRQEEFDVAFAELREKWASDHPDEIARVYAWTEKADAAFEWLEKSMPANRIDASRYLREPTFAKLHTDPRWPALLERLGLAPEQLAAIESKINFKIKMPK